MKKTTLKIYKPLKARVGFKKKYSPLKRSGSLKRTSFSRQPSDLALQVIEADSKFSRFIINRDKKCLRCGSTSFLSCSHYHGRAIFATRYDPFNCITLCIPCHEYFEVRKGGEYKEFMLNWLGIFEFNQLSMRSNLKLNPGEVISKANILFKPMEDIQY